MQIVRLVMMIVAVAGIIYALEYMERGIAVWFWITLLGVGFVGLLYTFRLTQRGRAARTPCPGAAGKEKIPPVETLTFIRRTSLPGGSVSGRRLAVSDGAVFPGRQFYSGRAGLFPAAGFRCLGRRQVRGAAWSSCLGWMSNASAPKSASGSQAAAGAGHDDGGRPAGRGVDVRKYPGNSYLCRGLCHQFRIAAGVGENRVPACRDVPQGFFQERGVRGRLLLRIIERRK